MQPLSIHTLAILTRFFPLYKTCLETVAVIIIGPKPVAHGQSRVPGTTFLQYCLGTGMRQAGAGAQIHPTQETPISRNIMVQTGPASPQNMAPLQSTPAMEGLEHHPSTLPGKTSSSRKGNMSRVVSMSG